MKIYKHVKHSVPANIADYLRLVRNTCLVSKLQPAVHEYVIG